MEVCYNIGEEGTMVKEAPATADDLSSKQQGLSIERKAEASAEGEKSAGAGNFGLVEGKNGMWILPEKEVQEILAWDRDMLVPELADSFMNHQKLIRGLHAANNGVVYLDAEMVAKRVEHLTTWEENRVIMLDLIAGLVDGELGHWTLSDRDSDDEIPVYRGEYDVADGQREYDVADGQGEYKVAVDEVAVCQGEYKVAVDEVAVGQATVEAN